ncbi:probable inactive receptor kinase at4g23740 [Phtheirospermum japonicum]|uniref:Probable inactive receptor kinase at4g23740 n=1 Tax=Phtheirospermum japonicum TaxID=374723 RepID=A0A830BTJ0_9LAMI|nr:probable inactive receptor kinase at4g23740 [Phtheirospermum japonicum]
MFSGCNGERRAHVDWESRLKIAVGAAWGIAEIHKHNGGKLVHGNIKTSNIFRNPDQYGCVSDLGPTNLIKTSFVPGAHCYAPESKRTKFVFQSSDVYSFGVLLLELLTRKPSVHVPGGPEAVDLVKLVTSIRNWDVLRASSDVIGKGTFGTSYKVMVEDENIIMVKTLSDVNVTFIDFQQQMEIIGRVRHGNVDKVRAFCFSSNQKFLVYNYHDHDSVSALLHGKIGTGRTPLDWDTRLKIAVGAARGIAHVHKQDGQKLVHGNVKSSNIFINGQNYGIVSDVGLAKLTSPVRQSRIQSPGYCAPEVTDTRRVSQASDVYSFGIFLLELLSRKPSQTTTDDGKVVPLVNWIRSVDRDQWTAEVFDLELLMYENEDEAMVQLLQIALDCISTLPERRPKMSEVVKMLEEISGIEPLSESGLEDTLEQQLSSESRLEDLLEDLLPTLTHYK